MTDHVATRTAQYIGSKPKSERKSLGQFFTSGETARFMARLFTVPQKTEISLLDPGAGTGILSAAVVEMIDRRHPNVSGVELTCYETNSDVVPLLKANLAYLQSVSRIKLTAKIITDNYLLSQSDDFAETRPTLNRPEKFDMAIGNPPYFKLQKDSPEAAAMPDVCHGAPNIYFLFASMSLFNLREDGEMVYIVPRSWTSGAYFRRFREFLLYHGKLTNIHVFGSRNKVFDKENVLQETMIMKLKKTKTKPQTVRITSSEDSGGLDNPRKLDAPYDMVVSGKERYVYLITSRHEMDVLQKVNTFRTPMPSMGLRMKTGLTVDFRNRGFLRNTRGNGTVPLFYPQHIRSGRITFPTGRDNEYISDELPGLVQLNRNYLFVKRFTAKEERRRLQCAVYLAEQFPNYEKISTQNKINFIDTTDGTGMTAELACGLYVVLNSTLYDTYYRILNGSTQVNSTEMNGIPIPERGILERLGRKLMEYGDYSTECCDRVLEEVAYA